MNIQNLNWRRTCVMVAAIAFLLLALPASAQTVRNALVFNDNTPELQSALTAYADELSLQGVSVQVTSDATDFGDQLSASAFDAYAAFGTNGALLDAWLAQTPDNTQFLKVTLTPGGDVETEYSSFITPGSSSTGVILGRQVSGVTGTTGLQVQRESEFSTATVDGGMTPVTTEPVQPLKTDPATRQALALGWPWDGLLEAAAELIGDWLDDILAWLQCIADCAQGCIDAFLDAIPEGVEVTITVEVQTTPPGVTTSISVTATGQAAVQVMRAYATMLKCIGDCVTNCSSNNRIAGY